MNVHERDPAMRPIQHWLAGAVLAVAMIAGGKTAAAEPVTIGVLVPQNGPLAEIGKDVVRGVETALIEAGHRAAGRELVTVIANTGGRPDVAVRSVSELIAEHDPDFLVGIVDSGVLYAVYDMCCRKDTPLIVTGAGADGLTKELARPSLFRTIGAASQSSHVLGDWLADSGFERLALIGSDNAAGYEETGGVARTFAKEGRAIVAAEYVPVGGDFAAPIERIASADPGAVVSTLLGEEATRFLRAFRKSRLARRALVPAGTLSDEVLADMLQLADVGATTAPLRLLWLADPRLSEGIVSATNYRAGLETDTNERFVSNYSERFGAMPTLFSESAYVAGRVVVETIETLHGDLTSRDDLLDTMHSIEMTAPRGPFRFDAFNNPVHNIYLTQIEITPAGPVAEPFAVYEDVSQFWTWTPETFMALPDYGALAELYGKSADPVADHVEVPKPRPAVPQRAQRQDRREDQASSSTADTVPAEL